MNSIPSFYTITVRNVFRCQKILSNSFIFCFSSQMTNFSFWTFFSSKFRFHPSEQIIGQNNFSLINFAGDLPTKLIIHGYIANRFHGSVEPVKNAYLGRGDVNVILVDWEQLAHRLYDESRSYVRQIGFRIGSLLANYVRYTIMSTKTNLQK